MTQNQIAYWQLQENKRHNVETEGISKDINEAQKLRWANQSQADLKNAATNEGNLLVRKDELGVKRGELEVKQGQLALDTYKNTGLFLAPVTSKRNGSSLLDIATNALKNSKPDNN